MAFQKIRSLRRRLRLLPVVLLMLLTMAGAGWLVHRITEHVALTELQATGLHRLDLYAASLEREIGKYAYLPGTLALERDVRALLQDAGAGPAAARVRLTADVNDYLEQLNARAGTLSVYVLDASGTVVATSNWRRPDSFMGEHLGFRAYFHDALALGNGRFFGIGTTRGEPGYYLATALTVGDRPLGVAVVKVSLEQLEKSWSTVEAPALVADDNGVVFLSSVADWKFTTLKPLDDAARRAFDQTLQYNRRALAPLGLAEVADVDLDRGARLVRIARRGAEPASVYPVAGRFLLQSRPLPGTGWTLTVLSHMEQVDEIVHSRTALGVVLAACVFLLGLSAEQRRRHLKVRLQARDALQKAHDELERKVGERTADLSSANQRLQSEVAERIAAERTLRAAQDELVQAGKLAVIGQLATGIAHELNQPLAALRTLSANAARFLERGDAATARSNLGRIAHLVDRMGDITSQLRSFARKSAGQIRPVALGPALDNAQGLLEPRLRQAGCVLRRDGGEVLPQVLCDANRLEQVLVNLIGNALDAMDGLASPRIEISCEHSDGRVRLAVRDHGPGLPEDVRPHLFEPFFTTKPAGAGLGLGLAISAGIVQDFGGTLTAGNHPGGGAVFTLDLPQAPGRPPAAGDTGSP